jgi:hypothetical protein
MKYSAAALLFLGVVSTANAWERPTQLAQLHSRQTSMNAVSESDSDSDDENLVQLNEPCEYLDETQDELDYQMDMFSRTLDPRHWTNVLNIAKAMGKANGGKQPRLSVHTWELMDKAFAFPRVRRYNFVQENMDMLEHFQDNWNTNISNEVNFQNFLRVARTVRDNFAAKYHDGEFDDPGKHDPREEAEKPKSWSF